MDRPCSRILELRAGGHLPEDLVVVARGRRVTGPRGADPEAAAGARRRRSRPGRIDTGQSVSGSIPALAVDRSARVRRNHEAPPRPPRHLTTTDTIRNIQLLGTDLHAAVKESDFGRCEEPVCEGGEGVCLRAAAPHPLIHSSKLTVPLPSASSRCASSRAASADSSCAHKGVRGIAVRRNGPPECSFGMMRPQRLRWGSEQNLPDGPHDTTELLGLHLAAPSIVSTVKSLLQLP